MVMDDHEAEFVYPIPADLEAIDLSKEAVHPIEHFYVPQRFKPYIKNIVLPDGVIQSRWARLAERIIQDYAGETELVKIVLMNGGYKFFEDLKAQINAQMRFNGESQMEQALQIRPHFIKLSSYKNTGSTGEVKGLELLEPLQLQGKNVLLIEDMIDTGTTMKAVLNKIPQLYQPKTLEVAIAFHKKTRKNTEWGYFGKYTGFLVEDNFCIGYGMDYNENFRDLPHLCEINELGIQTFKHKV